MNILISDSWLREYIDTEATPDQIKEYLSLCGPTIDRIQKKDNDNIYEVEITSNRIDMASVYGIAREAAAILPRFGIPAKLKPIEIPENIASKEEFPLSVEDPNHLCNRLLAIVLKDVKVEESPKYIKERLEKAGIRSLNNLIDITNYVMLELGHPTHVFDYDRIKTGKLLLRSAKKGEKLITLDNKECILDENDVIIDDGEGRIIDLPGIMGTENSVVTDKTQRIVFFIESNNPINIRKTSMRLGIRTQAATINEKHPDPQLAKIAFLRGVKLFEEITSAQVAGKFIDIYPHISKPQTIATSTEFINKRLGVTLKVEEIKTILESLGFTVKSYNLQPTTYNLSIIPPTFRQFDVTIPEDIVEEVARIYGYHNLPVNIMEGPIPLSEKPQDLPIEEKIKTILKYWGYIETYHYSFISQDLINKAGLEIESHLKVANPLTPETEYMRINLIPSMLETIVKNQPYSENLNLFELSKVYLPQESNLPSEVSMMTISSQESFYHLKGLVEGLLAELGIRNYESNVIASEAKQSLSHVFHPQQVLNITKDSNFLGTLGTLHPTISENFGIKKSTFIAYLNIENIIKVHKPYHKYTPIPQYPPIIEDISIEITPTTQIGQLMTEIYKVSNLVAKVELVDRYKDKITLRIAYQNPEKNLTNEDTKQIREEILSKLEATE